MTQDDAERFLAQFYPPRTVSPVGRPLVTLTFAQSLDGKVAGSGGRQIAISGHESLVMTHVLRTLHQAILVGVGTLLNDNPQLNARQLDPVPPVEALPIPVILDRTFRTPATSKVLLNAQAGRGKFPLLLGCAPKTAEVSARVRTLGSAGAQVAWPISDRASSWVSTLHLLKQRQIDSIMVEGGAQVISSLLQAAQRGEVHVDRVIITIGKSMVGSEGVGYHTPADALDGFDHVASQEFGSDTVVVFQAKAN